MFLHFPISNPHQRYKKLEYNSIRLAGRKFQYLQKQKPLYIIKLEETSTEVQIYKIILLKFLYTSFLSKLEIMSTRHQIKHSRCQIKCSRCQINTSDIKLNACDVKLNAILFEKNTLRKMFPPFCARQSASYPKNLFSRFLKKSFILSDFRKAQLFLKTKNEFPAIT